MPLAFESLSHGTVAFGFYNIETDGLLLDRLFFFCTDFCRAVDELAACTNAKTCRSALPGFEFDRAGDIGDLHGAIAGTSRAGYLGEIYGHWPFPADSSEFRQKLSGEANRARVEAALGRRAAPVEITLEAETPDGAVRIGRYRFSRQGFLSLLDYVWRGGYPTWEGAEAGQRPECVARLAGARTKLARPELSSDAR